MRITSLLADVRWLYPRATTTLAVQSVASITTLMAWSLLPHRLRPSDRLSLLAASAGSYAVLRLGAHTGWSKRFKHEALDRLGGDVDDAQTWLLGAIGGGASLVLIQFGRALLGPVAAGARPARRARVKA